MNSSFQQHVLCPGWNMEITPQNSKPSSVLNLLCKKGHALMMMNDLTQISQSSRSM